ncbi:MAG: CBS domain-containing protein [Pseudomonadota bacterium]
MPNVALDESCTGVSYCFLSDLLEKKIHDKEGKLIGRFYDIVASFDDRYPSIEGVLVSKAGLKICLSIHAIDILSLVYAKTATIIIDPPPLFQPKEGHFFVRDILYDRQIVDINGAKVERVNDIRISVCADKLRLVNVDVGFTGLARRLGFESSVRLLTKPFGKHLKDELIDWKFVHPLPESLTSPIHISLRQEQLKQLHAGELADIIEELDRDERITLVQSMDAEDAADALEEADISVQMSVLRDLDTELAADILEEMEPAVAADVMDKLPEASQQSIMAAMDVEERAQIELLVRAETDTAASLMTVDYISCPQTFTIGMALEMLKQNADEIDSINYIYCTDETSRLIGVVSLRWLLLSEPATQLSEIMNQRLAILSPDDDLSTVANQFLKLRFKSLPVVGDEGRVEGIVTFRHSFDELLPYYHKLAS